MSRTRLLGLAVALAALLALPSAAPAATTITMSGSTSIYPLAVKLAKAYKGKARFKILQGGSDVGVADVARGRVTIGNASRDPLPTDPGGLVFNKIARDGVCVVTNPANPMGNISQEIVQAIFSGQIRNWSEVPGARVNGPISLQVRTPASGTQDAFQNIFMGPDLRVTPNSTPHDSNGLVQQGVNSDPNAIGYVSLGIVSGVHAVPYSGVACDLRNAKSGQYGGTRNFWMVTRGAASGETAKFIKWAQKSSQASKIVATEWVPLR